VLPKPSLPLDPIIKDALDDARRPERIAALKRLAVRDLVYEDIKEEVRAIIEAHTE
jgi:formylmethanofuran:tetrahydromethanopterin formyltransferase